jgi:ComEC/Rec2-related protein
MILIVLTALIFSISTLLGLPGKLTEATVTLHHFCLRALPSAVENRSSLEALVCGKNLQDLNLKELLLQSSLIHIFVVSGSHFIFLRKILAKLPFVRKCPLAILSIYALVTLCQPPSLRALLFLSLAEVSERRKLFLSPVILVFISSLLSVALFPQWLFSRSLLMSMMAALVIAVMSDIWEKDSKSLPALFISQSALYLVMGFCLWGFSSLHPLSILLNIILGPLIGGVLFPLGFIVVLIPPLAFLFDFVMNALIWILKKNSELVGAGSEASPLGFYWQWILFFTLLISSYYYLIERKREKARYV